MTENTSNPNVPHKLNDEELASVTGGASWQVIMEEDAYDTYLMYKRDRRPFKDATFEEFLQYFYRNHPDYLQCREAWLAAGQPKNLSFRIGDDGAITSSEFTGTRLKQR